MTEEQYFDGLIDDLVAFAYRFGWLDAKVGKEEYPLREKKVLQMKQDVKRFYAEAVAPPDATALVAEGLALAEKASKEPWSVEYESEYDEYTDQFFRYPVGIHPIIDALDTDHPDAEDDLEFICWLHNNFNRLLAAVRGGINE